MVTAGPEGSNGRSHGARDYPGAAASQYPGLGLLNKGIKDGMDVPQPAWLWPQEASVFSGTQCPHLENRGQLTHSSAKALLDWGCAATGLDRAPRAGTSELCWLWGALE